jgi:hypothetical protein
MMSAIGPVWTIGEAYGVVIEAGKPLESMTQRQVADVIWKSLTSARPCGNNETA